MPITNPGIGFERLVYEIQSRMDPNSQVSHNEIITDRLGQKRQFDIVIRGKIGGQNILGIIECKDQKKRVGTPQIEAFVTKASDINANFKIFVSRTGFFTTAIDKAKHYGIKTLSLIPGESDSIGFHIGQLWYADIYNWKQISITLLYIDGAEGKPSFKVEDVKIKGARVLDWFTNYLLKNHPTEHKTGWVVGVGIEFDSPQLVSTSNTTSYICKGIEFHAERAIMHKQKFVGLHGSGFYDWQSKAATFVPDDKIATSPVPTDFDQWESANSDEENKSGLLEIKLIVSMKQFDQVADVVDLETI